MHGAYGLRLSGVPTAERLLVPAPAHWPVLELDVHVTTEDRPRYDRVDNERAIIRLRSGGWVTIERGAGRATFCMSHRPVDAAIVHPHLASVAVILSHWLGRETFHAGAFVAGGGVWGVLGDKGAGKSSLLAMLALGGTPVVCDDVLALDGGTALSGPRSIDLRTPAARALATGTELGVLGGRKRWRMALDPVGAELPIRGWVMLRWSERTEVNPVRGSERLRNLARNRGGRLYPPEPATLLDLSALPFYELSRARNWATAPEARERLLDAVG